MTEVFHLLSYPCHEVKWCFPATEMDFALPVLSSPQHPAWPDPPFRDEHLHVAQKCKVGQGPWRSSLVMLQSCFPFSMAFWSDGVTSVESKRSETKNCQMRWKWVSCDKYIPLCCPSRTWRQGFMVRCSYRWAYGSQLCFKESEKKILLTSLANAEVEMFMLNQTHTMDFVKQTGTC